MAIFGWLVLGYVTVLGGGTLRDVNLRTQPVVWISDTLYLWLAATAAGATFVAVRRWSLSATARLRECHRPGSFHGNRVPEGFQETHGYGIDIVMGVTTGVVGSIMRDVLAGGIPLILRREIYATASMCGAFHGNSGHLGDLGNAACRPALESGAADLLAQERWRKSGGMRTAGQVLVETHGQ